MGMFSPLLLRRRLSPQPLPGMERPWSTAFGAVAGLEGGNVNLIQTPCCPPFCRDCWWNVNYSKLGTAEMKTNNIQHFLRWIFVVLLHRFSRSNFCFANRFVPSSRWIWIGISGIHLPKKLKVILEYLSRWIPEFSINLKSLWGPFFHWGRGFTSIFWNPSSLWKLQPVKVEFDNDNCKIRRKLPSNNGAKTL